jgi:hypothetical protein
MVGSIVAANHVVIVTTPELASYEGTYELVDFSRDLVENEKVPLASQVVVINEYRDNDEAFANFLKKRFGLDPEVVPTIYRNDDTYSVLKEYTNPSMHKIPDIWYKVELLALGAKMPPDKTQGQNHMPPADESGGSKEPNPDTNPAENEDQ